MTSHTCAECKQPMDGKGQTCSPKCRKRRQRRQHEARLALPLAMYELGKIRDSLKRRERISDFTADLLRLKAEINDLLVLAGEPDSIAKVEMLSARARLHSK